MNEAGSDRGVDAPAACANCGAPLSGPFCAQCGQEVKPLDPPVRRFAAEFAQELFDVDGRVPRSLRRLLFSPGFLTREHVEGRRIPWLSPLKLYLLASVAMFSVSAIAGGLGELKLVTSEDVRAVNEELRKSGYASLGELQRAIEAARLEWVPRVMFVLVPLLAGLAGLVERRSRRHFPAHLVFALHVHAAGFAARAVAEGAALVVAPAWREGFGHAAGIYIVGYVFLAFRTAYGAPRWRAAIDTALVAVVYVIVLVSATAVIIGLTMFGSQWLTGRF